MCQAMLGDQLAPACRRPQLLPPQAEALNPSQAPDFCKAQCVSMHPFVLPGALSTIRHLMLCLVGLRSQFCLRTLNTSALWSVAMTGHMAAAHTMLTRPKPAPNSQAEPPSTRLLRLSQCCCRYSASRCEAGHSFCPVRSKSAAQSDSSRSWGPLRYSDSATHTPHALVAAGHARSRSDPPCKVGTSIGS